MDRLQATLERIANAAEQIACQLAAVVRLHTPLREQERPPPAPQTGSPSPALHAELPDLTSITGSLARLADALAPTHAEVVGTPYIAGRLGCTTVWVAEMARQGDIPRPCVVPGTGFGKPWKFYRNKIDEWLASR